jgi:ribosomal protein S19
MSRSIYKPSFIHKSLFEDCLINKEKNTIKNNIVIDKQKNIPRFLYFWTKNSLLNLNLLDKKISIYNGKVFISLNVIKQIIGYKIGSFCVTRKKPPHIGKQKQNKKVSRSQQKLVAERKRIINRGKIKSKK